MSEKVRNEHGQIAVLYSPGFGAGWFTWNGEFPDCLYDADIVRAVEAEDRAKAEALAEAKWPDGYWGGARDLKVVWMSPGTQFRVDEYDGSESIAYADRAEWQTAMP